MTEAPDALKKTKGPCFLTSPGMLRGAPSCELMTCNSSQGSGRRRRQMVTRGALVFKTSTGAVTSVSMSHCM